MINQQMINQQMINQRGHLSSETIDLLLLSALNPADTNAAKQHLDTCAFCKTRWVELNEDKEQFDQSVFARTLPSVEQRIVKRPLFSWKWLVPAVALGTAALTVGLINRTSTLQPDDQYVGIKGIEPSLQVFALRPPSTTAFEVKRGGTLKPGDRLRFVVTSGNKKWVLIGSQDAAGTVSVYAPFGGARSEQISDGRAQRVELSSTLELDGTLGEEHVVAIFSDEPVSAATLEAVLKNPAAAPADAKVISWDFSKAVP